MSSPALVLRVLYRLRSLSEQSPFDAATFSYTSPLLTQVLVKGGVALAEEDDPLEQVTLAVDIIRFHSGECEHFPLAHNFTIAEIFISFRPTISQVSDNARLTLRHQAST